MLLTAHVAEVVPDAAGRSAVRRHREDYGIIASNVLML